MLNLKTNSKFYDILANTINNYITKIYVLIYLLQILL